MEAYEKKEFLNALKVPLLFLALLWVILGIESYFGLDFGRFGILPRTISGLKGIIFAPLIHGGFKHLFNNSIPLLVLGWALFYFYKKVAFRVVILSYLLSGLYTWISARTNYHIGASGLVYSLFGFLVLSGFIRRYIPLIALSFLVSFLYGSLVWGILPYDVTMSWEGHFWGLLIGVVLAIYYRKQGPSRKKYSWDYEEEEVEEEEEQLQVPEQFPQSVSFEYRYHFIPKKKEGEDPDLK